MSYRTLVILFSGICLLSGCNNSNKPSKVFEVKKTADAEEAPFARLSITKNIDLGEFKDGELKKTATVAFTNSGTADLYIRAVQPECDCTTAVLVDSVIPPMGQGTVNVSLDLSEYQPDTISKSIALITNSRPEKVVYFNLVGIRK